MPTVLVLDVSLSMSRPVAGTADGGERWLRRQLAIHGINSLLDQITSVNKMEFVSLVIFSSQWELLVPFTRDVDSIRAALLKLEEYDKTNIMNALGGLNSMVLEEWGAVTPCQVILITDGSTGVGPGCLHNALQDYAKTQQDLPVDQPYSLIRISTFQLPFRFNGKLHVMCIANQGELKESLPLYEKLVEINNNGGEVFVPETTLSIKSVEAMFRKLGDVYYYQWKATLKCGHLQNSVLLFPPPDPVKTENGDGEPITMDTVIDIIGFLSIADIASPPVMSKHLVLPLTSSGTLKTVDSQTTTQTQSQSESLDSSRTDEEDDGKTPAFTVLLHGSLKVESMVAIVKIGEDWFGMLYSFADSKKKSNLMLSPFEPGIDNISWLGPLSRLSPISDFMEPPYGDEDNVKTPFPVRQDRRSYAQNSTVWIKAPGLQADVQKILRHGRKLPEKQQHFYKELNRLRKMALSLGFTDLLTAMAEMLEREFALLPGNAHADTRLQLSHAASALKSPAASDYSTNIMPLRTNYSADD